MGKEIVVSDGSGDNLTPEEVHKIEVKIDKMLDPTLPDEPAFVPPVIALTPATEPEPVPVAEPPAKQKAPKPSKPRAKKQPVASKQPTVELEPERKTAPPLPETVTSTKIAVTVSKPKPAEPLEPIVPEPKKYRPPEGPMQFKRAEPIEPPLLTEHATDGIAQQDTKKTEVAAPKSAHKRRGHPLRGGVVLLLLLLVLAGVVLAALPNVRTKLQNAVGYQATKPSSSKSAATAPVLEPAMLSEDLFVGRQGGTYNVYKIDLDGQNKILLLAGTGYETSQISLVPNVAGDQVALISTRDNQRDSDGSLLQTLTLINTKTGATTTVSHASQLEIIGWFGARLVYTTGKDTTSSSDPARYQLVSYDYQTSKSLTLDHANYFNDVVAANGTIYYATSNNYSGGVPQFIKINADASGKQVLLSSEILHVFRTSYTDFVLVGANSRYAFTLGASKPTLTTSNYNGAGRLYVDSPDGKYSVWVNSQDGKGTLVRYDKSTQKETTLAAQAGLTYPVRWLNDTKLIYRVESSQETADYTVTQGGTPTKITNVADVAGLELWY